MKTLYELCDLYSTMLESNDDPNDFDDDELDIKTSPSRSFANPFDQKPKGNVVGQQKSNPRSVSNAIKPDQKLSKPGPGVRVNDFSSSSPVARKSDPQKTPNYPKFQGSFKGHEWNPGGTYDTKTSMYKTDKPVGPDDSGWRFRKHQTLQKGHGVVWDGDKWVPQADFDVRFGVKGKK